MAFQTGTGGAYNPNVKPGATPAQQGASTINALTTAGGPSSAGGAYGPSNSTSPGAVHPRYLGTDPHPAPTQGPSTWNQPPPASAPAAGAAPAPAAASPTYGTQSGPGILGQWFNQRANGTDPGWEYATGRAADSINNQYAARGGYNSSGATQSIGDMFANATTQREAQLDALAGGASTEHQNSLNSMFTQGTGIANGVSGAGEQYGLASGTEQQQNTANQMYLMLTKAGVDAKTAAAEASAISGGFNAVNSLAQSGPDNLSKIMGSGGGGGGLGMAAAL